MHGTSVINMPFITRPNTETLAIIDFFSVKLFRNNRERRLREERGDRMLLSSPNMSSEQARRNISNCVI